MPDELPLHGGQLRRIAERYGLAQARLIDFSANINPGGPPPALLTALREGAEDPRMLCDYPDLELPELRTALARYAGVAMDNITVGSGFVPLLETALRVSRIKRCAMPVPCFVEYRRTLERAGVEVVTYALEKESGFACNLEALSTVGEDAILLANPQNPSGALTTRGDLLALVQRAAERKVTVLLDEAFIDYVPEHSLAEDVERLSNLVVFRSVTKFFGVPGLRVAYAVAGNRRSHVLQKASAPWPVTALAACAVAAGLADMQFAVDARERNARRRLKLASSMAELGLRSYEAAANFLLIRPVPGVDMRALRVRLIEEHGIVVRDCDNYEGLSRGHVRVAIRGDEENDRLVRALRQVFAADGLRGHNPR